MRLLIVNSNTSAYVTSRVAEAARAVARPDTEIVARNGRFVAHVIGTRTELAVAEHATLDLLAQFAEGPERADAVVIAVSYDVALRAAREMLDVPVVGITEAALLTACMLGGQIGLVVFGDRVLPLYQELVRSYGLQDRVAGWRVVESNAPYAAGDQSQAEAMAVAAANALVRQDGAEVVVLTGAVMAGVPARLQPQIDVPVLDGVSCAVRQAELLAAMRPIKPRTGSYAALPPREMSGVDAALAAQFGRRSA